MKKTFKLEHPKVKVPRIVDSIRHDIKKYLTKERKSPLPPDAKYWGFECRVGQSEALAESVPLQSLSSSIDALVENGSKTVYVEITPKPVKADDTQSRGERY
jgi:hypothetical protein